MTDEDAGFLIRATFSGWGYRDLLSPVILVLMAMGRDESLTRMLIKLEMTRDLVIKNIVLSSI